MPSCRPREGGALSDSREFSGFARAAERGLDQVRDYLTDQWRRAFDADQWDSASTFREKLSAISLPHAGAGLTVVGVLLVGGIVLLGGPGGPSAPPLPSETARESIRSATRAYEGELSPALAAANAPVEGPAQ